MKKILLLMTMVLTCVGAWAQGDIPSFTKTYIINSQERGYLYFDSSKSETNVRATWIENQVSVNNNNVPNSSNTQFAFLEDPNGDIYIYSYGAKKFLTQSGTHILVTDEPSTPVSLTQNGNYFVISFKNTNAEINVTSWDGNKNGIRVADADPDGGNKMSIIVAAEDVDLKAAINKLPNIKALGTAITNAKTYFDNTPIGEGVGKYSSSIENYAQEFYGEIEPFYNGITEDTEISAIEEKTARIAEILASFTLNMPVQGKFYRIAYDYGGSVGKLYLQSINSSVKGLKFTESTGVSSIWYYDGALMSYDKGLYIKEDGNTRGLQNIGIKQDVSFIPSTRANSRYNIKVTSYIHANSDTNGNYFADHCGSDGGHATHDLILEEVTYLPVSISEAYYSTLYSPVALEVTGGVKAYTITVNGEWAHLNEITDNVIPANTGVVLYHENDATEHYDFVIASVDSNVETSPLTGTFAATYVADDAYVLANGDNGVGFYIAEKNQVTNTKFLNNAFKAYLPASAVTSGVKALRFNFDGETTAIETVETEKANAPIYDLSGRRVVNTVKGGIYIQNGKKFIVK